MPRNHRSRRQNHKHKPRHLHHQQKSQWLLKPSRFKYLPAIIITVIATFVWAQPQFMLFGKSKDVLAYATEMTHAGLLSATNSQRTAHGVAALSLNTKLNNAAQAKANDMVARDYWSHQTPDGRQPWVFIVNAGYQYLAAGENLAYGFSTSSGAVTGWMNSPSHKANLLNAVFTEVGFGIANSANYVGNGPQTVVVAMYAKPQGSPPPANQNTETPNVQNQSQQQPQSQKPQSSSQKPNSQANSQPTQQAPAEEPSAENEPEPEETKEEPIAIAANSEETPPTATTTQVQRIHILTGGSAIWSATFVVLGVCAIGVLWLLHRGFRFGKWLKASEKVVGKYLHLDLTVLSIIYLGFVLLSASGVVK